MRVPGKAANAVASGQLSRLASDCASSSTSVGVSLSGTSAAVGVPGTSMLWCGAPSGLCCVLLSYAAQEFAVVLGVVYD